MSATSRDLTKGCQWEAWSPWSPCSCSQSSAPLLQIRTRHRQLRLHDGKPSVECSAYLVESQTCIPVVRCTALPGKPLVPAPVQPSAEALRDQMATPQIAPASTPQTASPVAVPPQTSRVVPDPHEGKDSEKVTKFGASTAAPTIVEGPPMQEADGDDDDNDDDEVLWGLCWPTMCPKGWKLRDDLPDNLQCEQRKCTKDNCCQVAPTITSTSTTVSMTSTSTTTATHIIVAGAFAGSGSATTTVATNITANTTLHGTAAADSAPKAKGIMIVYFVFFLLACCAAGFMGDILAFGKRINTGWPGPDMAEGGER